MRAFDLLSPGGRVIAWWSLFATLGLVACAERPAGLGEPSPERWRAVKKEIRDRFPDVVNLTTRDVRTELGRPAPRVLLVDVRTAREYAVSHLQGARSLPDGRGLTGVAKDRPIIVYCSVGYRSAAAVARLQSAGFRNVRNYLGSIFEWANEGLPLVNDAGPTGKVDPYDEDWGRLLRPSHR